MDRVTVAYLDEPPFCIPGQHAEPVGADMELARRALTDAGVVINDYALTTFPELIPGLIVGRWQMTTGMFITPERSQVIAYSRPIWAAPDGFVVRTGDSDRLTSYEAIAADAHAVLAVVTGQVQHQTALRAGVPSRRIIQFSRSGDRHPSGVASTSRRRGQHGHRESSLCPADRRSRFGRRCRPTHRAAGFCTPRGLCLQPDRHGSDIRRRPRPAVLSGQSGALGHDGQVWVLGRPV